MKKYMPSTILKNGIMAKTAPCLKWKLMIGFYNEIIYHFKYKTIPLIILSYWKSAKYFRTRQEVK